MPDLAMRFHKEMLVLSSPIEPFLAKQGIDLDKDLEYVSLIEPEAFSDAYNMETIAGAQCLVTHTANLVPSLLMHKRLEDRYEELIDVAFKAVEVFNPQHIIAEIGTTGLPLDPSNEASLEQVAQQYISVVSAFDKHIYDAVFLNGLRNIDEFKCAIDACKSCTELPVIASFDIDEDLQQSDSGLEDMISGLSGADVIGFRTGIAPEGVYSIVEKVARLTDKPLLVQLSVDPATSSERKLASLGGSVPGKPYALAEDLAQIALNLRALGVQFLRACGNSSASYTGALTVACLGLDALR